MSADNIPKETSDALAMGDFAIPKPGHYIVCGSGMYERAVVMSLEPFVLISEWGDMMWNHQKAKDFMSGGRADEKSWRAAVGRAERDGLLVKERIGA